MALAFPNRGTRAEHRPVPSPMAREVRAGLTDRPPWLPSKYLYDDRGSALFEEITRLPEYYQTRTEEAILAEAAGEIVARLAPRELVELGSGSGRKIRLLLDALCNGAALGAAGGSGAAAAARDHRLVLFDINARLVRESARRLAAEYPGLKVRGLIGDFTGSLEALGPNPSISGAGGAGGAGGARLAILFAGTIGNLVPAEARLFLHRMALRLEPGDGFLVGLDLVKDPARLEAAYNDSAGVTAEFNLNILEHVNRELGGDFDLSRWRHRAFFDRRNEWIEMRLVSLARQRVHIEDARLDLCFGPGDEIVTEYSCKYTRASFAGTVRGTGLRLDRWYGDADRLFALALLRREE